MSILKKSLSIIIGIGMIFAVFALAGCAEKIDYLVLVNKQNALPADWENKVEIVKTVNSLEDEVLVEKSAYDAYLKLKAALEEEGVFVDLDSAYRSVASQQDIWDRFTDMYGIDYVRQYVAVPGFSEHHTGLALDLYLNIDGVDVYMNEDMVLYPEIWAKIHAKLADYGFILRYLEGKEAITGYSYEPWHLRYVGDVKIAKEITEQGITLEEYLGKA
ncbi:MAG: M15 family metallopeptidase [Eggerthellaceae bacterium]|nr:M15 family metallopeptidase [Eggerthellaceae bacterium]